MRTLGAAAASASTTAISAFESTSKGSQVSQVSQAPPVSHVSHAPPASHVPHALPESSASSASSASFANHVSHVPHVLSSSLNGNGDYQTLPSIGYCFFFSKKITEDETYLRSLQLSGSFKGSLALPVVNIMLRGNELTPYQEIFFGFKSLKYCKRC